MGFLDALLGKRKVAGAAAKNTLFALTTAYVSLEAEQGITTVQRSVLDKALAAVAENDFAAADAAGPARGVSQRRMTIIHGTIHNSGASPLTTKNVCQP